MMILMLATAMTVVMLIGTIFGLREEAEAIKIKNRSRSQNSFGGFNR